ncbi:MAG: hypothetical protein AAB388_00890 [Patescibacteria group bacterium]
MKKSDLLSLLVTFVVGFLGGAYLYVTQFATLYNPDVVATAEEVDTFTIVGEAYGGCRNLCPSFKLEHNGEYRYLYTPGVGLDQVVREGILPLTLQSELKKNITRLELIAQSKKIQPAVCNSYTDGIDVRYTITQNGDEFILNSCGTATLADSPLWTSLAKIWNYFENRI